MRRTGDATEQMIDDYEAAYADYVDRRAHYDSLTRWQRFKTPRPEWNATQPGFYVVEVYHYRDRVEQEDLRSDPGSWALFAFEHIYVDDYSIAWYAARDRAMREQEERDRQMASTVWRANAGDNYYKLDHPEAWQRDNFY